MVHFNELRITSDGQYLIIDVAVRNESYYKDVYLDSILIDNQDTYVGTGPSSTPIFEYTVPTTQIVDGKAKQVQQKSIRLVLEAIDLTTRSLKDLLFVYVRVKGTPTPNTPCDMDNITTLGTVVNMYPFYQQAINYIGELASNCNIPQNFIDFILRTKALELSLKTGNYPDAIKFFNKFFNGKDTTVIRKGGCGCGNS